MAITSALTKKLNSSLKKHLTKKATSLPNTEVYTLNHNNLTLHPAKSSNSNYPYPFSKDFFELLRKDNKDTSVYKKYSSQKIVILVKVIHQQRKFLLDQLSDWVLANTIMKKITLLDQIEEIKSNGSLGIFVTDSVSQAIEFASDLKDTMSANGYLANVGISKGEVLIFPMGNGIKEIAGGPVNISSKLSEDSGGNGEVLIEDSVKLKNTKTPKLQKFKIQLSSIELKGYKF